VCVSVCRENTKIASDDRQRRCRSGSNGAGRRCRSIPIPSAAVRSLTRRLSIGSAPHWQSEPERLEASSRTERHRPRRIQLPEPACAGLKRDATAADSSLCLHPQRMQLACRLRSFGLADAAPPLAQRRQTNATLTLTIIIITIIIKALISERQLVIAHTLAELEQQESNRCAAAAAASLQPAASLEPSYSTRPPFKAIVITRRQRVTMRTKSLRLREMARSAGFKHRQSRRTDMMKFKELKVWPDGRRFEDNSSESCGRGRREGERKRAQ
jgi:hypothetical protein